MKTTAMFTPFTVALIVFLIILFAAPTAGQSNRCRCSSRRSRGSGRTRSRACQDARSKCRINAGCPRNYICSSRPRCGISERDTMRVPGGFICIIRCRARGSTTCRCENGCGTPGGIWGDPHFAGFDGTKFDFHGEPGKKYVIFGRSTGDYLVSEMRSAGTTSAGVNVTFFSHIALQMGESDDKVDISLTESTDGVALWEALVKVNGVPSGTVELESALIWVRDDNRMVVIDTLEARYDIWANGVTSDKDRHFDFSARTIGPPRNDIYLGVLGFTMNNALGRTTSPDLVPTTDAVALEMEMRRRFVVGSLFPAKDADVDLQSGSARGQTNALFITGEPKEASSNSTHA